MRNSPFLIYFQRIETGFTFLEILVSVLLFSMLLASSANMMFQSFESSLDSEVIIQTEERARSALELLVFELRMLGSGVALGQKDFDISDDTLGDAPLPIFIDSSDDYLHFRINETGKDTYIVGDFIPTWSSRTFTVASSEDIFVGDIVYISDRIAGGDDGLRGEVEAISGTNITLSNDFISSPDASFPSGSTVNRVSEVEYSSPANWGGITRDNGLGALTLVPNSQFSVTYLKSDDTAISLPLSESEITEDLTALDIQVQVRSDRRLKDGTYYSATAQTRVTTRTLFFY
ncbi:MAG: hypothetical protein KDD60_04575 [Bdellovibrionales bacterium]|nr:hypothetical protein [Bdellovibrionales bacterium]